MRLALVRPFPRYCCGRKSRPFAVHLQEFFNWFNRVFNRATDGYVKGCGVLLHKFAYSLILLVGLSLIAGWFGSKVPAGFLPDEDQGLCVCGGSTSRKCLLIAAHAECAAEKDREDHPANTRGLLPHSRYNGSRLQLVERRSGIPTARFLGDAKEWSRNARRRRNNSMAIGSSISNRLISRIPEGTAFVFAPPAIPGVGAAGGFTFILEDRSGKDIPFLVSERNMQTLFLAAARKRPELHGHVHSSPALAVPQIFAKVDRDKVT